MFLRREDIINSYTKQSLKEECLSMIRWHDFRKTVDHYGVDFHIKEFFGSIENLESLCAQFGLDFQYDNTKRTKSLLIKDPSDPGFLVVSDNLNPFEEIESTIAQPEHVNPELQTISTNTSSTQQSILEQGYTKTTLKAKCEEMIAQFEKNRYLKLGIEHYIICYFQSDDNLKALCEHFGLKCHCKKPRRQYQLQITDPDDILFLVSNNQTRKRKAQAKGQEQNKRHKTNTGQLTDIQESDEYTTINLTIINSAEDDTWQVIRFDNDDHIAPIHSASSQSTTIVQQVLHTTRNNIPVRNTQTVPTAVVPLILTPSLNANVNNQAPDHKQETSERFPENFGDSFNKLWSEMNSGLIPTVSTLFNQESTTQFLPFSENGDDILNNDIFKFE